MGDFFLFAFLPGGDDGTAAFVLEQHGATFALIEIGGVDLSPIDKRECKPVSKHGPKLFLQVQRKRGATGPYSM